MMAKRKLWDRLRIEDHLALIEGMARDGLTEEQIAENLGVSYRTLNRWKKSHPQFDQALARGKQIPDRHVENSLFRSATGYEYEEEHVTPTGKVVKVRRYQPPNTTAMIFWLKNRKPDKWRDKQDIEHSGQVTVNFVDDIGDDDGS